MSPRVFFITGISTGFDEELVKVVLQKGDYVVATARNSSKLSFENANSSNSISVDLDVTDKESIDHAFDETIKKFKRVDVVVNNAGYGLNGPFETLSEKQIRAQMEINFFGLLDVTRKAMQVSFPAYSIYCASKWAVEGFTESVSKEVKPEWGIKFTCIEPGGFRTDWAGRSMDFGEIDHPAYDHINGRDIARKRHGNQAGDPAKAAIVFYELAVMDNPPLRCIVGTDAYKLMNQKLDTYSKNVKQYEHLSNSIDVD